jgi:hypothetical protein
MTRATELTAPSPHSPVYNLGKITVPTWSPGRDYDEPCRHVVVVTTALLVDSGMLKGKE